MPEFSFRNELQQVNDLTYLEYLEYEATKKATKKAEEILKSLICGIKFYEHTSGCKVNSLKFMFVYTSETTDGITLFVYSDNSRQKGNEVLMFNQFKGCEIQKVVTALKEVLGKDYKIQSLDDQTLGFKEVLDSFSMML